MAEGELLFAAGALLAAGLAASLVADVVRVPGLVLFLGIGMLLGSDGLSVIAFDDYELAKAIGVLALVLILFEGGLTAGWGEIRPVLGPAASLAVIGTLITASITAVVAYGLFELSMTEAFLLGAIVSSTDGAAIFALLRRSTLQRRVARTLEGESGFNDPMAVILVLAFVEVLVDPGHGIGSILAEAAQELVVGLLVGLGTGRLAVGALQRARLPTAGLYPVASLATAALAYGVADLLHGSGFLAVYLAALALGSAAIPAQRTVVAFHQGLAWVAQLGMFFALGLLVFPSQLDEVAVRGTALALVIVFVARPVATWLATFGFGFSWQERVVLGWAGLRGAVPVVLATFPVIEGVGGGVELFNIVFFAVLVSTLLQGSTFEPFAKWLGTTTDEPALPEPLAEAGTTRKLGAEVMDYPVGREDAVVGARLRELGLPREAVVTVIVREGQAIPPRGSTLVRGGDVLHVLYREEVARQIPDLLRRWRSGPLGTPEMLRPTRRGTAPVFAVRPWDPAEGDPAHPETIGLTRVLQALRVRRDAPGGLFVLEDGRYAVCGPIVATGSRRAVSQWAQRRMSVAGPDERAWLRTVVGALAAEIAERPR